MAVDRWKVRECCGRIYDLRVGSWCEECLGDLPDETFEVVRAQAHRTSDPDPSRLAALQNEPRRGTQRALVLAAIRQAGSVGQTAREAERATGVDRAGRRVSELVQGGHIVPHGERTDPRTKAVATVYVIPSYATSPGGLF